MTRIQEMGFERPAFQDLPISFLWVSFLSTGWVVLGGIHDANSTMWGTTQVRKRMCRSHQMLKLKGLLFVHGVVVKVERERTLKTQVPHGLE